MSLVALVNTLVLDLEIRHHHLHETPRKTRVADVRAQLGQHRQLKLVVGCDGDLVAVLLGASTKQSKERGDVVDEHRHVRGEASTDVHKVVRRGRRDVRGWGVGVLGLVAKEIVGDLKDRLDHPVTSI